MTGGFQATLLAIAAGALAVACGIVAAESPGRAVIGVSAMLAAAAFVTLPMRGFAAAALAAAAILPLVLLEARASGTSLSATPISGQARLIVTVAAICAARYAVTKQPLRIPHVVGVAAVIYAVGALAPVMVAYLRQTNYSGMTGDLSRQLTYVLAAAIGVMSFAAARTEKEKVRFYRSLAYAALAVYGLTILYWAWTVNALPRHLPVVASLFDDVSANSVYTVHRSIVPLTDDSPNISAVIFVFLGACVVPPLILDGDRRVRRLGAVVTVGAVAAVLTTQSRTGLATLAVAPVAFALAGPRIISRRRFLIGLVVIALLTAVAYQAFPSDRRLSTRTETLQSRESLWRQATAVIAAHPYIGEGYRYSARENFVEALPGSTLASPSARFQSIHSDYLGAVVDGGIIGGAALATVLFLLARLALNASRATGFVRSQGIGFLCGLSSLAFAMTASSVLQSAVAQVVLWLFVGIVGAGLLAEQANDG